MHPLTMLKDFVIVVSFGGLSQDERRQCRIIDEEESTEAVWPCTYIPSVNLLSWARAC